MPQAALPAVDAARHGLLARPASLHPGRLDAKPVLHVAQLARASLGRGQDLLDHVGGGAGVHLGEGGVERVGLEHQLGRLG